MTVAYEEGTVFELIATSACVQPGDSGGLLRAEGVAVGITSGHAGTSCTDTDFLSFFQPMDEALDAQGLVLKTT